MRLNRRDGLARQPYLFALSTSVNTSGCAPFDSGLSSILNVASWPERARKGRCPKEVGYSFNGTEG